MRKIAYSSLIAAATLFATGCSQDDLLVNGEGTSTFTITLPAEIGSRSFADGLSADKLEYAVYDAEGSNRLIQTGDVAFDTNSLTTTVSLALANGKNYQIAFFAHNSSATGVYTFDAAAKSVSVDYTKMTAYNTTDYDCFYSSYTTGVVTGAISQTITLARPMAQVNWGTSDLAVYNQMYGDAASQLSSKVTFQGVYSQFDLLSGAVKGETSDIAFPLLAAPGAAETFPVEPGKYQYLSMNYLLVPSASSVLVEAELTPNNGSLDMTPVTVNSMPVQANYRTNVYGPLLTSPADFEVTKEIRFTADNNLFDSEQFRIASTLAEAKSFLAAGEPKVVIDGSLLVEPSRAAAAGAVVFTLNKTVKSQKLKVNGAAANPVKVEYAPVAEGTPVATDREFVLILQGAVEAVEFDLPEADVTVEGRSENGGRVDVNNVTVTNAATASVTGPVNVGTVDKSESVPSNVVIAVTEIDAASFVKFIKDVNTDVINVDHDIDLAEADPDTMMVAGKKVVNIAKGKTVKFGPNTSFYLEAGDDLTINGGTITNADTPDPVNGSPKTMFLVFHANLTINGTTLINDMKWHTNGYTIINESFGYNNAVINYWGKSNITIKKSNFYSGGYCVCALSNYGIDNSSVTNISDSYFESNSSNKDTDKYSGGSSYCYALRVFGETLLMDRSTVKGVQGCLTAQGVKATLRNCVMEARHRDGEDGFYAVHATKYAEVTIESGDYSGCKDWSFLNDYVYLPIEGFSAVVSGDNDVNMPTGSIIIKGGRFSGKAYNYAPGNKRIYQPADGKQWVPIVGHPVFKWTVK